MPIAEIRTAISSDIPTLMGFDHGFSTDHVWQMGFHGQGDGIEIQFQEVRLPRPMRVTYPRSPENLADEWSHRLAVFAAEGEPGLMGYACLAEAPAPGIVWMTDVVVDLRHRRQGIGSALVRGACRWAKERGYDAIFMEMQTKNFPAIGMAKKLGLGFSGYSDNYYPDQDIALFFSMLIT
jgi:ribosomal protein S18 acetylase RimI-like enzyme